MGFGSTIRAARKAKHLSQVEVAELLGTSQTNLSGWERDEYRPGPSHLLKLAEILDIDPAELLRLAAAAGSDISSPPGGAHADVSGPTGTATAMTHELPVVDRGAEPSAAAAVP